MLGRAPLLLAAAFCGVFVGLPLVVMLWETVDTPDGLSLSAWQSLLADPVDRQQLWRSLELGLAATAIAALLGFGHAWLTCDTDMPGARLLGPLGVAPLVVPPILVAMGFADLADVAGFWPCAGLLGVSYAPFVAVLTARGLRAVDGRAYETALLARGPRASNGLLARMILPEVLAGCLFAFLFVVSEHGVPEFLTVKGKTWHTYAEGIFARWTRRATGVEHQDLVGPIVAAAPLVAMTALALILALWLRAKATVRGDFRPLPTRRLGALRWPGLLIPAVYLAAGVGVPVLVMGLWAAGSTDVSQPLSLAKLQQSLQLAVREAGSDLGYTVGIATVTTLVLVGLAIPLARRAARRSPVVDYLCVLPVAVPAILLAIGIVHVFNNPAAGAVYAVTGDFYDSAGIVVAAYAARFLPFAVLTLSHATRRIAPALDEAALLTGRGPVARAVGVQLPLILPAAWSAGCLVFVLALRELDIAVVLPAGNGTVVRRLSNVVHFGGEDMGGALALLLLLVGVLLPVLTILLSGRRLRPLS